MSKFKDKMLLSEDSLPNDRWEFRRDFWAYKEIKISFDVEKLCKQNINFSWSIADKFRGGSESYSTKNAMAKLIPTPKEVHETIHSIDWLYKVKENMLIAKILLHCDKKEKQKIFTSKLENDIKEKILSIMENYKR